ncbi:hypothetical protein HK104_001178 [Borealophlyctis nickersoniae]|nr:hypothetical protein HK104_001178 [Borealophlyctis nickersoniae]
MYQTCAVFQICSFGLQFAIVLQYLQATQQCLQYRLLWNKLIISLSLLIFLVSAVLVFMGMATVRAETGLNAPMRFGFAIFGAYSSITSIVIAAAVAVMVLHTKRNVVRAREREQPEYAETAKWLESIGRRMAVITLLFVSMTLGVIVYFGRAKAGDRLAATIIKLDGVLIQSWLLYLIHAIRTVSEISTQFGSTTTHEGLTKFATSVAPNTEDRVVVVDAGHKSLRAEEMEPGSTC